jgi:trans-aconitate methyltransferase
VVLRFWRTTVISQTPPKAVDIGCGTGIATIQLAAMLPSANVVGVDITPVPAPALAAASPNLQWETGNILDVDMEKQTDSLSRGALATKHYWLLLWTYIVPGYQRLAQVLPGYQPHASGPRHH